MLGRSGAAGAQEHGADQAALCWWRPGRHLSVRGWQRRLRWHQPALESSVLVFCPMPLDEGWRLVPSLPLSLRASAGRGSKCLRPWRLLRRRALAPRQQTCAQPGLCVRWWKPAACWAQAAAVEEHSDKRAREGPVNHSKEKGKGLLLKECAFLIKLLFFIAVFGCFVIS